MCLCVCVLIPCGVCVCVYCHMISVCLYNSIVIMKWSWRHILLSKKTSTVYFSVDVYSYWYKSSCCRTHQTQCHPSWSRGEDLCHASRLLWRSLNKFLWVTQYRVVEDVELLHKSLAYNTEETFQDFLVILKYLLENF